MNSQKSIFIIIIVVLVAFALFVGYMVRGMNATQNQTIVSVTPTPDSGTPTDPRLSPQVSLSPAASEVEDNPDRIETDDNPGERNRRGRGND